MARINLHETIRPHDIRHQHGVREESFEPGLTRARTESLWAIRTDMLASVKAAISERFREALAAKLNYERAVLLEIVTADETMVAEKKRRVPLLHPQYFVEKVLDSNIF